MNTTVHSDIEQRIKGVMADLLDIDAEEITLATSQSNVSQWDSFHHLQLVMALEHELGIRLSMEEIGEMTSLEAILRVAQAHL